PAWVSRTIGRRGPVPVVAWLDGRVEVRASLVPKGGGRHRLRLNARVRREAGIEPGDHTSVVLHADEHPVADPTPPDLARALADQDLLALFERMPVGKRNHIIAYVDSAVAEGTRARRIEMA